MDYIGYRCPVCDKDFIQDDDVVVCPECGTPHHRDCYDSIGHCANIEKHGEDFDFESESSDNSENSAPDGFVKCSSCGAINNKNMMFCTKCNAPLIDIPNQTQNTNTQQNPYGNPMGGGMPFGGPMGGSPFGNPMGNNPMGNNPMGGFNAIPFDPMAGVSPETEFENGAKAGEVAKYVKQSTPYFMQVFNRIKSFGKSKFSFAALLFGGGYFLYRKQYLLGTIITVIMAGCLIFATFGEYTVLSSVINEVGKENQLTSYTQMFNLIGEKIVDLNIQDQIIAIASIVCLVVYYALHIVCGFIANRCYYKHCCKQVNKIKANAKDSSQSDNELQTKGGVNSALGFSLLAVLLIINVLPRFLL